MKLQNAIQRIAVKKLLAATLALTLLLSGCETLLMAGKALGFPAPRQGISVDAQIGDRDNEAQLGGARGTGKIEAEDNATVNVNTSKTDANVERANKVVVNNYDPWMLVALVAVITLFVPSPLGPVKRLFSRLIPWRRTTPPQT